MNANHSGIYKKLKQRIKNSPIMYSIAKKTLTLYNLCSLRVTFKALSEFEERVKRADSVKLHLGCGTVYKDGWINIDNNSDKDIAKLDFKWSLAKGIPLSDGSVDYIYHEHFLEHLTREEGAAFLAECLRCLRNGGVMRFSTPDLCATLEEYQDSAVFLKNAPFREKFGYGNKSPCETLNTSFHWWGHKFLYDKAELVQLLTEIGADSNKITFCESGISADPQLCGLETRDDTGFIISEVVK